MSSLTFCLKYARPAAMTIHIAMHLDPPSEYATCPNQTERSCNVETGENVGLGILDCADGNCVVCRSQTTCSGRGKCGKSGGCACFPGFSGVNCNVSACPHDCNGHGLCDISKTKFILGLSIFDASKHAGACRCFKGWSGPHCSSEDIYTEREALWQGALFVGVVSAVVACSALARNFSRSSFRRRLRVGLRMGLRRRHLPRRHLRPIEVELEEFINPL